MLVRNPGGDGVRTRPRDSILPRRAGTREGEPGLASGWSRLAGAGLGFAANCSFSFLVRHLKSLVQWWEWMKEVRGLRGEGEGAPLQEEFERFGRARLGPNVYQVRENANGALGIVHDHLKKLGKCRGRKV